MGGGRQYPAMEGAVPNKTSATFSDSAGQRDSEAVVPLSLPSPATTTGTGSKAHPMSARQSNSTDEPHAAATSTPSPSHSPFSLTDIFLTPLMSAINTITALVTSDRGSDVEIKGQSVSEADMTSIDSRDTPLSGEKPLDPIIARKIPRRTWYQQGHFAKAEKLKIEILELRKSALGEKHPDTITAMANLASVWYHQGHLDKAVRLEIEVLELCRSVLGWKHPETIRAMENLASIWCQQGHLDKAEGLQIEILELCKSVSGEQHPDTLTAMTNLASTWYCQSHFDKVERLQIEVLELCKSVLGEKHPDTIRAMATLASIWYRQGHLDKAEEFQIEVLELCKSVLGEKHPDAITATTNLGLIWYQQGHLNKVEGLGVDVLEMCKSFFEEKHPQAIRATKSLGHNPQDRNYNALPFPQNTSSSCDPIPGSCREMVRDCPTTAESGYTKLASLDNSSPLPTGVGRTGNAAIDSITCHSVTDGSVEESKADSGTDTHYSTDSSDSGTDEGTLSPCLANKKRELVDRVMSYFYSLFRTGSNAIIRRNDNHNGSYSNSQPPSGDTTGSNTTHGSKRSRHANGSENKTGDCNGDEEDEDNDETRKHRKIEQHPPKLEVNCQKFACPFFKRNPRKYRSQRTCPGPGWENVHRVKEHIYRRHTLPIQCPRCCIEFKDDTLLKAHQRSKIPCEVGEGEPREGVDEEKKRRLKDRKKKLPKMSEEDKWRGIYRILFPDDDPEAMPTPYYDYDDGVDNVGQSSPISAEFARYEEFLKRELPPRVRRELERVIDQELEPVEEKLKERVLDIVRELQVTLLRIYQQSRGLPRAAAEEGHDGTIPAMVSSDMGGSPIVGANTVVQDSLAPFDCPPDLGDNVELFDFDIFQLNFPTEEWPLDSASSSIMPSALSHETPWNDETPETSVHSLLSSPTADPQNQKS